MHCRLPYGRAPWTLISNRCRSIGDVPGLRGLRGRVPSGASFLEGYAPQQMLAVIDAAVM
jgi:hypothetical protein